MCCFFTGCKFSQLSKDSDTTQLNVLEMFCAGGPAALLQHGPRSRPSVNVFGSQVCCPPMGKRQNCGCFKMTSEGIFQMEREGAVSAESVNAGGV